MQQPFRKPNQEKKAPNQTNGSPFASQLPPRLEASVLNVAQRQSQQQVQNSDVDANRDNNNDFSHLNDSQVDVKLDDDDLDAEAFDSNFVLGQTSQKDLNQTFIHGNRLDASLASKSVVTSTVSSQRTSVIPSPSQTKKISTLQQSNNGIDELEINNLAPEIPIESNKQLTEGGQHNTPQLQADELQQEYEGVILNLDDDLDENELSPQYLAASQQTRGNLLPVQPQTNFQIYHDSQESVVDRRLTQSQSQLEQQSYMTLLEAIQLGPVLAHDGQGPRNYDVCHDRSKLKQFIANNRSIFP